MNAITPRRLWTGVAIAAVILAATIAAHLPSLAADTVPVTADNFVRAESDLYLAAEVRL